MVTPKKEAIVERAIELFHDDQWKNGIRNAVNPEYSELLESGYIAQAQSELMTSEKRKNAESDFIDFPREFSVDLKELYESNGLILGSRHSGKSDLAMMICERAMKENTIVIVFDPSLDWIQRSNVPRYVTVETDLIVPNESTIYDLSLTSPYQQQRIVEEFCKRLFESQAKKSIGQHLLVIFEESHTYFYQGCMRAKNMQNCVRMLSVGRNVHIACVLISQFPSMVDKFCVKHAMSQVWFGFTKEPNDVKYLRMLLDDNVEQLKKLEDGQFIFMNRSGISKIQIEPYKDNVTKNKPISIIDMVYGENNLAYSVNVEPFRE